MLYDLRTAPDIDSDADVVIIGSGAVGLCTAVDLARSGVRVLLLEAGGRTLVEDGQKLFEGAVSVGHPLAGLHFGRYRMLGGTTNFWAGQVVALEDIVFRARKWVGDTGWPITGAHLLPAIRHAYEMLGLSDALPDDSVWPRMGVAHPSIERDIEFFFTRWVPEPTLSRLFKNDIKNNDNLKVVLNANVVSLVPQGGRVAGVVVRGTGHEEKIFYGKKIILANGTIEVARLLMQAFHDGAPPPWLGNAWLGRGFIEHLDVYAGDVEILDKERFHLLFDSILVDKNKYALKLRLSEEAQIKYNLLGIAGHFMYNSGIKEQIDHMKKIGRGIISGSLDWKLLQNPGSVLRSAPLLLPLILRYLRYRRTYNPSDCGVKFRLTCEQMPETDSRIYLSGKSDPYGMSLVELDWQINGGEIETMAHFSEQVSAFLEKEGLARLSTDPLLKSRDRAFVSRFEDAFHHMGTARMAATPQDGVVDSELKVFGTENLFVAGAAAFRSTGFANPTLTAIALGLRLSQNIKGDRSVFEQSGGRFH